MSPLHLAVALDGTGWHPASWRAADARPDALFTAAYWAELVREAETGRLDFVTIEDSQALQSTDDRGPDARVDRVRGRLDALLIAARIAPLTRSIGLVPTVTVTHAEPFHTGKAVATLDYVSGGRAGWQVRVSARKAEADHFGRRSFPVFDPAERDTRQLNQLVTDLFDEAADYVDVVRRLWDSWEDDAEIRDVATGRFVDRNRLHYIDFAGKWFSVKGPSITPRPPQGQPLVTALAHATTSYRLAARTSDVVFVTPRDAAHATAIAAEVAAEQAAAGRTDDTVHVFGDLVVFLDNDPGLAAARKARLDELSGAEYEPDATVFTGTPGQLAELLLDWQRAGLSGIRLRPGTVPHDLNAITRGLVPELQRRQAFRRDYTDRSLRARLGLPRPASRYAA